MNRLALFILLTISAVAQSTPYMFECSKLLEPSAGCKSYNEMVVVGDKDLLGSLKLNNNFVCFLPGEDVFFVVSYSDPDYDLFTQVGTSTIYQQNGMVYYSRYKNGISDDFQLASGKWRKFAKDGQSPVFFGDRGGDNNTSISDSEIAFQYSFKNLYSTMTLYSVSVRRSTLRFVETYQWQNPPEEKVTTKKATQKEAKEEPVMTRNETTGHCAYFPRTTE